MDRDVYKTAFAKSRAGAISHLQNCSVVEGAGKVGCTTQSKVLDGGMDQRYPFCQQQCHPGSKPVSKSHRDNQFRWLGNTNNR